MSAGFLKDAGERILSSFGEGVLAAALSGALAKGVNASTTHVLLIAGLTAAATTAKTLLAGVLPTRGASLVPEKPKGRSKKVS